MWRFHVCLPILSLLNWLREELNFDRDSSRGSASFAPSKFLDGPAQISFRPPLTDCTLSERNKDKIAT